MKLELLTCLIFGILLIGVCDIAQATVRIVGADEDNRKIVLSVMSSEATSSSTPVLISSSAKDLTFHFTEDSAASRTPERLRYKLEGYDTRWHNLDSNMNVWLRLCDKKLDIVAGMSEHNLRGETPGWMGQVKDAPLVKLSLQVTAPAPASYFAVYFLSRSRSEALGLMVIDRVNVRVEHANGATPESFLLDLATDQDLDTSYGTPRRWGREGDKPQIAQVGWRTSPSPHPVLLLNDNDPNQFGVWKSRNVDVAINTGDRVTLNWQTAYSIGIGGSGSATYARLKPGNYWFRVAALGVNGMPTGEEASLPVIVVPPLYQRPTLWLVIFVAFSVILGFVIRRVTRNKIRRQMQQRIQRLEYQRMIEVERTRIARDIHDDLGSVLAQIAMLSEMAHADQGIRRDLLGDIFNRAHTATRGLDEIVWALKPANDTVEHLIGYLCQFSENYLNLAGLHFRLDAPDEVPPYVITTVQRHNLFLAAKEALHNVVKHAGATEVWLRVRVIKDVLHLIIEDNGNGQVSDSDVALDRGSANMKIRMVQIGGHYSRLGKKDVGTTVEFTLLLKEESL